MNDGEKDPQILEDFLTGNLTKDHFFPHFFENGTDYFHIASINNELFVVGEEGEFSLKTNSIRWSEYKIIPFMRSEILIVISEKINLQFVYKEQNLPKEKNIEGYIIMEIEISDHNPVFKNCVTFSDIENDYNIDVTITKKIRGSGWKTIKNYGLMTKGVR